MKKRKNFIKISHLTVILFLLFNFVVYGQEQGFWKSRSLKGEIELKLKSMKDTYLRGEYIFADLEIKNLTNRYVTLPQLDIVPVGAIVVGVIDYEGRPFYRGWSINRLGYSIDTLKPKEVRIENISIHQAGYNDSIQHFPLTRILPGRYRILVKIEDVVSNTFEINIVEPEGEEKIVYRRFIEEVIKIIEENPELGIYNGEKLIELYPQSVYIPVLYDCLIFNLLYEPRFREKYRSKLFLIILDFINKYPDYNDCRWMLYSYSLALEFKLEEEDVIKDKRIIIDTIIKEFTKLKRLYPKNRVAKCINEEIRKLQIEKSNINK